VPSPALPDLSGLTLLVVEDDDDALEAATALARFDTTATIDAVVTDVSMPSVDGIELVRAFLQKPVDLDALCQAIHEVTRR